MTLLTTWLDPGKRVVRKISNVGSRASYGPYHGLELPNHGVVNNIDTCTLECTFDNRLIIIIIVFIAGFHSMYKDMYMNMDPI